jgi:CSLREA domain-containing protein
MTIGAVHSAHATSFTVTDTSDSYTQGDGVCSLREAVDTANWNDCWDDCGCGGTGAGEIDYVILASGTTYTLNGVLDIWDPLVLSGNHAVIRGSGADVFNGLRLFAWHYLTDVALENFRVASLVVETGAQVSATGLEVRNNELTPAAGQTSSILVRAGAYLYLNAAYIHHNTRSIKGGGIFIETDGAVVLYASLIESNQVSQYGGGVHNQGHFHCYGDSYIRGNSAGYGGGGVSNVAGAVFDNESCHIIDNTSTRGGANIHP